MYHIYHNGERKGPLTLDQLKGYSLGLQSRIWREGMTDWGYVGDMPEVVAALSLPSTEKKPRLNWQICINIAAMIWVTLSIYTLEEDYGQEFTSIFAMIMGLFIVLYLVSIGLLFARRWTAAKIVSIIACAPLIPIGLVGMFGVTKAIEKATRGKD